MEALILAGGYGKRLGFDIPKPLVEVGGKPVIEYTLEKIVKIGKAKKITVSVNEKFEEQFREWAKGKEIKILVEPHREDGKKLGSIGGIKYYLDKKYSKGDLLIAAGDNVCDFQIDELYNAAVSYKKPVIGVYKVRDKGTIAGKLGNVVFGKGKKIAKIVEKPNVPLSPYAVTGYFVLPEEYTKTIEQYMALGKNPDSFGYFLQWLVQEHEVYGHIFKGVWFDIGTRESLEEAERYFKSIIHK